MQIETIEGRKIVESILIFHDLFRLSKNVYYKTLLLLHDMDVAVA
jgi:hypothetical protein